MISVPKMISKKGKRMDIKISIMQTLPISSLMKNSSNGIWLIFFHKMIPRITIISKVKPFKMNITGNSSGNPNPTPKRMTNHPKKPGKLTRVTNHRLFPIKSAKRKKI